MQKELLDTSLHERRLRRRLQDPGFADEYRRATREIAEVDGIIRRIDRLRVEHNLTKAELARRIGKHPAAVRRLFTGEANPTLATVVELLSALDASLQITEHEHEPVG